MNALGVGIFWVMFLLGGFGYIDRVGMPFGWFLVLLFAVPCLLVLLSYRIKRGVGQG